MTRPFACVDARNDLLRSFSLRHPAFWNEFSELLNVSWIYHDHALEGVVLQHHEITSALAQRGVYDNPLLPALQEIKNLHLAIHEIRHILDDRTKRERYTRDFLQDLYDKLILRLRGIPEGIGVRQDDGRYGSYYHKCVTFQDIEKELALLLTDLNALPLEPQHPLIRAASLHHRFMKLMPYGRFSGRLARLLTNMFLMEQGYPPAIIHAVERARYYEALAAEDESMILELLGDAVKATVESGLQHIETSLQNRQRKRKLRPATPATPAPAKAKGTKASKPRTASKQKEAARKRKTETAPAPSQSTHRQVRSSSSTPKPS